MKVERRCSATDDPCPKDAGQKVRVDWKVRGAAPPDFVVVKIRGTTIESWDPGIGWWNSGVLPLRMLTDPTFTFRPTWAQVRTDANGGFAITDFEDVLDCAAAGGGSRSCGYAGADGTAPIGRYPALEQWIWKGTGTFDVTVTAQRKREDGSQVTMCDETRRFRVDRSATDLDRQATDYYTTGDFNNPDHDPSQFHGDWHEARDRQQPFMGEDWLVFHRVLVKSFDDWSTFFGYPRITPYDGGAPVPTTDASFTMHDATRPATASGTFVPDCYKNGTGCTPRPWFTAAGDGTSVRGDDLGGASCVYGADRDGDGRADPVPTGQMKLGDFRDARGLGCVINKTHHAFMHASVPGSFPFIETTPRDPLFWAYHKFASGIDEPGIRLATRATTFTPRLLAAWEREMAKGPPGLTAAFPPRDLSIARLPGVMVFFWEAVSGVVAGDLVVGSSRATKVVGYGAGPYVFSGFTAPVASGGPVPVTVTLGAGAIRDRDQKPFAGDAWQYTIAPDRDGDDFPDVRDNCPDVANYEQTNTDALQRARFAYHDAVDGLADARGDACDDDDDGDGISDAAEIAAGSDPLDWRDPDRCPGDPAKTDPGACGCGFREVPIAGGDIDCVVARPTSCIPGPTALHAGHTGARAEAAACDDGDPCTTDACIEGTGCTNVPLAGLAAARCVCDRGAAPACASQTIPVAVAKQRTKACSLLTRAAAPGLRVKKAAKLVRQGAARWRSALRAAGRRSVAKKLRGACLDALKESLRDAGARADAAKTAP